MNRSVVWLVILVAVIGPAGAATYYVDSADGRDDPAWNGGPADPWATLTYALSRVSGENTFMCRGRFEEEVTVAWEDRRSVFTANPDAMLEGWVQCEYETGVDLNGFRVYGYAAGGSKSGIAARDCYFQNPAGAVLGIHRFHGGARAERCRIENSASVCGASGWEFGSLTFRDCEIEDCGSGITFSGGATTNLTRCRFSNVAGTAFDGNFYEEGATFTGCEFYDCGAGIVLDGTLLYGYWGRIEDCVFRGNGLGLSVVKETDWGSVEITGSRFAENSGNGMALEGITIKLRGNVITDNDGHGVYITEGDPDLGTPGDPGGNTFAGNKSGYDVYNASPENVPACGNTWDPQSQQEMEGKTWQDVNVTRIYDHWDNPNVGYVKWSDFSAVRPASLGRIKASFREGPASPARPPEVKVTGD